MAVDVLSMLEHEAGFSTMSDFIFDASATRLPTGGVLIDCWAEHPEGQVGFRARIDSQGWNRQDGEGYTFHWGQVDLYSMGEPSDRLLHLFETFYGQKKSDSIFVKSIICTAVMLEGSPNTLETVPTRTKLFFNDEGTEETDYAEIFLNFDLADSVAVLAEKDEEYRVPLVAALRHEAGGLIGPLQ